MSDLTDHSYKRYLLFIWLASATLILILASKTISEWRVGDPDDFLHMVQARDWINGQNWFDITQYRMNPPEGGPMHWLQQGSPLHRSRFRYNCDQCELIIMDSKFSYFRPASIF